MTLSEQPNEAESLEQLFMKFAHTILAQLNARVTAEEMPQGVDRVVTFSEHGYWPQYRVKNEYEHLMIYIDSSFWDQEVVKQFVRKQWAAWQATPMKGAIKQPYPSEVVTELASQWLYQEYWFPVLDTIERYDTLQPTQEQLMESYSRYQKWWTTDGIQWDMIIPLTQFTCDLKMPIRISPHLQLASFTLEEKASVWNRHTNAVYPDPVSIRAFLETSFKLIGTYIKSRDEDESLELTKEVENMITALRLVKAGNVGVLASFENNQMPRSYALMALPYVRLLDDQGLGTLASFYVLPLHIGPLYTLSEAELHVVQKLSEALQKLDIQKSGMTVALRRFNQAYSRKIQEDRIIDLTIALESCLLADVSTEELNYRLALRGAALLALEKLWLPEKAQALLKTMYAIRSAIVHAGQRLSHLGKEQKKLLQRLEISPDEFPERCENIVRDILRTYVMWLRRNNGSVQTICSELDRSILQGLTQPSSEEGGEAHA